MTHNIARAERLRKLSVAELKRRVDAGSLTSAAAEYALFAYHDIVYPVFRVR